MEAGGICKVELIGLIQHSFAFRAVPSCSPTFNQVIKQQLVQPTIFITFIFGPPASRKESLDLVLLVALIFPLGRIEVGDEVAGKIAPSAASCPLLCGETS